MSHQSAFGIFGAVGQVTHRFDDILPENLISCGTMKAGVSLPVQQTAFRAFAYETADCQVIVFGDLKLEPRPMQGLKSLEQVAFWASCYFHRFCGVVNRPGSTILFVDHAASLPVFYRLDDDGTLFFANQAMALKRFGGKLRCVDYGDIRPLPAFGGSNFVGVESVPSGSAVVFSRLDLRLRRLETVRHSLYVTSGDIKDEKAAMEAIADSLPVSVAECLNGATEAAFTLSGGVDSASVATLARPYLSKMYTYTVGTDYGNEFAEARKMAEFLGSEHTEMSFTLQDAADLLRPAMEAFETWDPLTLQIALPVCFLYRRLAGKHPLVLTGYGSDLIFGGVVNMDLPPEDINKILENQVALTVPTNELAQTFAAHTGVVVRYPFWSRRVIQAGLRIDASLKVRHRWEKFILRESISSVMDGTAAWRRKLGIHEGTSMGALFTDLLGEGDLARQALVLKNHARELFEQ